MIIFESLLTTFIAIVFMCFSTDGPRSTDESHTILDWPPLLKSYFTCVYFNHKPTSDSVKYIDFEWLKTEKKIKFCSVGPQKFITSVLSISKTTVLD